MLYFIDLSDLESWAPESSIVYMRDEVEKVKRLLCTHDYRSHIASESKAELLSKVLGKTIPVNKEPPDMDKILKEDPYIIIVNAEQIEDVVFINMFIVKPKNKIAML